MERNYVLEAALTAQRKLEKNLDLGVLDELTEEKITRLNYMVIFLNDQLYNSSMELEGLMKKGGFMRHEAKFYFNNVKKCIEEYNRRIDNLGDKYIEMIADITSSMEEDLLPHLNMYKYQVSQMLLNNDITGIANQALSVIDCMMLIHSVAESNVKAIKDILYEFTGAGEHYTDCLDISRINVNLKRLSNAIASKVIPKGKEVHFEDNEKVNMAFKVVRNKLYSAELYNKALANWSYEVGEEELCS